ncbi:MAG TPA: DUF2917 domain-containing protein [Burkholderiaceae bacterium]|jgi:hypothetical protein|nr:DUF2917 domain-containing protein [Burkholderiaceae bacterium]
MRILFTKEAVGIKAGHVVAGVSRRVQTLQIISGSVWLTVEGRSEDHWLSAGDSFAVEPGRLVVVEADKADSCVVRQPTVPQPALAGWRTRLAGLLHRIARRPAAIAPQQVCTCR